MESRAGDRRWRRWGALCTAGACLLCPAAAWAQQTNTYIDTDGKVKNFQFEYARTLKQPEPPHHLRSFTEMGIGLAFFAAAYWATAHKQLEDWDDPEFRYRFTGDAWRTDNNSLMMNFLLHPLSGGYSYALARGNHHNVAVSATYGFISSFLWEFVFEFREFVSVNDLIATPVAGISLGEFLNKMGLYLDTAKNPGVGTRIAQWVAGTGVRLDRALDGRKASVPPARDNLGLTSDIAHDFWVTGNVHAGDNGRPGTFGIYRGGYQGSLVSLPGYNKPGRYGVFFHRADVASLAVGIEGSEYGMGGMLSADTLLLGYHAQDIKGSPRASRGGSITVGFGTAYDYLDSKASGFREQLGAIHLAGPGLDWHAHGGKVRVDATARAHVDYAGVSVQAYPEWLEAYPLELGKHILRNRGYTYAWGGSGSVSAKIDAGPLRLVGSAYYGKYWSQDGRNRYQERITVDVRTKTEFLNLKGAVQFRPTSLPVAVGAGVELRRWDSRAEQFKNRSQLISQGLDVSVRF